MVGARPRVKRDLASLSLLCLLSCLVSHVWSPDPRAGVAGSGDPPVVEIVALSLVAGVPRAPRSPWSGVCRRRPGFLPGRSLSAGLLPACASLCCRAGEPAVLLAYRPGLSLFSFFPVSLSPSSEVGAPSLNPPVSVVTGLISGLTKGSGTSRRKSPGGRVSPGARAWASVGGARVSSPVVCRLRVSSSLGRRLACGGVHLGTGHSHKVPHRMAPQKGRRRRGQKPPSLVFVAVKSVPNDRRLVSILGGRDLAPWAHLS